MSFTRDVVGGLAELLAAAGVGIYRPTGVYGPDETGITAGVMPEAPDRIVCLTPYPVDEGDLTFDVITGMQVRIRGSGPDPRPVEDVADAVRDLLHGREGYQLGSVHVALSWRRSQAPLGQDAQGRAEIAANYYLRAVRPGPNLYE
ncbi:minor capsid protein [Streptomyces sp. NBC_01808]|uniref:minor capsid protein n=1 Tax=Streptomyces sp. NBC_01808 TaxID=2975947 RepID=UPI002DDA685A|nr:minor capsid protein [Streptomyces sp. NBC_01808]WSA39470.1 minor capsid protein [Streptomyces sp. NBC_01808]